MFLISFAFALTYQRFVLRRDVAGALTAMQGSDDGWHAARRRPRGMWLPAPADAVGPLRRRHRRPVVVLVPVVYAVLCGFRTTDQISADPIGLPSTVGVRQLPRDPRGSDVLAAAPQQTYRWPPSRWRLVVPCRVAGGIRASPGSSSRGGRPCTRCFTVGLLFPLTGRGPALVHHCCGPPTCSTTHSVWSLPQAAFALPVSIIVLRPFFRSIPAELEEAAAMDGCGPFRFF